MPSGRLEIPAQFDHEHPAVAVERDLGGIFDERAPTTPVRSGSPAGAAAVSLLRRATAAAPAASATNRLSRSQGRLRRARRRDRGRRRRSESFHDPARSTLARAVRAGPPRSPARRQRTTDGGAVSLSWRCAPGAGIIVPACRVPGYQGSFRLQAEYQGCHVASAFRRKCQGCQGAGLGIRDLGFGIRNSRDPGSGTRDAPFPHVSVLRCQADSGVVVRVGAALVVRHSEPVQKEVSDARSATVVRHGFRVDLFGCGNRHVLCASERTAARDRTGAAGRRCTRARCRSAAESQCRRDRSGSQEHDGAARHQGAASRAERQRVGAEPRELRRGAGQSVSRTCPTP